MAAEKDKGLFGFEVSFGTKAGGAPELEQQPGETEEAVDIEDAVFDFEEDEEDDGAVNMDEEDELEEDSQDSLTYSNGVIEKIVAMATREVPHVLGMKGNFFHQLQEQFGQEVLTKGVTVDVTDDNRVIVNLSVIIEYGCYAPGIFDDAKQRVTAALESMTGLEVAGVNMRIENVVTPEEYEKVSRHLVGGHKGEAPTEVEPKELEAAPEEVAGNLPESQ